MIKEKLPDKCDVLVIGSGFAGLTAAATLKNAKPNCSVCLIEQTDSIGGASAYSGGIAWLPGHKFQDNPAMDSERAEIYMKNVHPDISSAELAGFLNDAPKVLEFLDSKGCEMEALSKYPDYYMDIEGSAIGRSVSVKVYKGSRKMTSLIRKVPAYLLPLTVKEMTDWGAHRMLNWNFAAILGRKIRGNMTLGRGLIAFLLDICLNLDIDIFLGHKAENLIIENNKVTGAVLNGRKLSAPIVIMACAGFSHHSELMKNLELSRQILSAAPEECDTGGGLSLALDAGLAVGNPYCWWMPMLKLYGDNEKKPGPDLWAYFPTVYDRARPGGIVVNSEGKRFINEASCYNTVGGKMALDKDSSLNKVWMIYGNYYVKHYPRGMELWFQPAKSYMNKSKTVEELSRKIDVPVHNLKETIDNWNHMAAKGIDTEFHRGENAYDHFTGDPFRKGHPNIEKIGPPFQAIQLHPGCLGTKMGPITDEYGQTMLNNGEIVSGLYSIGTASASLFGNTYPGAGSPTAQCLVFGYRAGLHAAGAR